MQVYVGEIRSYEGEDLWNVLLITAPKPHNILARNLVQLPVGRAEDARNPFSSLVMIRQMIGSQVVVFRLADSGIQWHFQKEFSSLTG